MIEKAPSKDTASYTEVFRSWIFRLGIFGLMLAVCFFVGFQLAVYWENFISVDPELDGMALAAVWFVGLALLAMTLVGACGAAIHLGIGMTSRRYLSSVGGTHPNPLIAQERSPSRNQVILDQQGQVAGTVLPRMARDATKPHLQLLVDNSHWSE